MLASTQICIWSLLYLTLYIGAGKKTSITFDRNNIFDEVKTYFYEILRRIRLSSVFFFFFFFLFFSSRGLGCLPAPK